ncbi:retrovirus-related pol polyprotein from transposon TNT 1-94, partial [Tanacetum coccineum]
MFQKHESCDNQNALEILEFFAYNDLKAQFQDKDNTICKLKDMIQSMRKNYKDESVKYDYCEIENKNVELENSVAKLLSENERICNEINHVKQVFKEQFDSIKKTRACSKEQGKEIVDIASQIPSANTIVPGMFKLDLEPLASRLLQTREAHIDYLKYTQEQADILREIVKQAKAEHPLDKELDLPVVVIPKNKVKKVRFPELLTSLSNNKQVESSKISDFNTPVLSSTRLKCSTSKSRSKPNSNKRNDRISQTPSRNMKNKVEAQPRKVNKKNRVVKPFHDVSVKYSLFHANSEPVCATVKKLLFDGLVLTEVGLKWKPTDRTFTIVGNMKRDYFRAKDEAPGAIIKCIKNIQVRLNATVRNVRKDNGTEFINQTLREFYENIGISHQISVVSTPQQNGVVKRRNQTLVEAARTMLIFSKDPLFLWAEAINTTCYIKNRSIIGRGYNKTPYELIQYKKPDLSFFHVIGALCYPTNDSDDMLYYKATPPDIFSLRHIFEGVPDWYQSTGYREL